MKILIVSNMYPTEGRPHFGTFVKACVDGYVQQGAETSVVAIQGEGVTSYVRFYCKVFFTCILRHFDYVHIHYVTHSAPPVCFARCLKKFKIILNFHGSDAFPEVYEPKSRRKLKNLICKLAIKKSDLVIAPSEYFAKKIMYKYTVKNIFVSPSGGVDPELFKYKPATGNVVLFAGRLIKDKGPIIAAKTIRSLAHSIDKVIFVGSGPELPSVKRILEGMAVEYWEMLPRVKLAEKMAESDLFLFPSVREGESLGLVLVEAVFSGSIPIAIDNGAVKEIIPDSLTGKLISTIGDYDKKVSYILNLKASDKALISDTLLIEAVKNYSSLQVSENLFNKVSGLAGYH